MDTNACRRHHRFFRIVKLVLQTATLVTAGAAVYELDRIHHRLKKIEKREHHAGHHIL